MTPSTERRILALATKLLGFTFEVLPMDLSMWRSQTSPINHHVPKSYKWVGIVRYQDGRVYSINRFKSAKDATLSHVRLAAFFLHSLKCDCSESFGHHPDLRARPWGDTHGQLDRVSNI